MRSIAQQLPLNDSSNTNYEFLCLGIRNFCSEIVIIVTALISSLQKGKVMNQVVDKR